jgi:hypothetical protein
MEIRTCKKSIISEMSQIKRGESDRVRRKLLVIVGIGDKEKGVKSRLSGIH